MPECDGGESRKKDMDGARLNPKRLEMGNQQPSREQRKVQRLSPWGEYTASDWQWKWCAPVYRQGEDIVCAHAKA